QAGYGFHEFQGGSFVDVSSDGRVAVGNDSKEASVWDAANGRRSLRSVLESEYGLARDLEGWDLKHALAISCDGNTIVGWGDSPHGDQRYWYARLDQPIGSNLIGDFNASGVLDIADINLLVTAAASGNFEARFDLTG